MGSLTGCLLLVWMLYAKLFTAIKLTDLLDIPNDSSLPASAPSFEPLWVPRERTGPAHPSPALQELSL